MNSSEVNTSCIVPEVSVLMAVFDTPTVYLDAAIGSILSQSFTDFEFIIIDDGSGAETENRLRYWAQREPRIRLYREDKNIGLTKALNIGLNLVRGNYVARQDADDMSDRVRLEKQLRFMERHPNVDAVGTNAILIDATASTTGTSEISSDLKGLDRRNILVHGSMFFRRIVFKLVGGYDERMRLSQDYELYLRMMRSYGMRLGILSETHYYLRQHPSSLSSKNTFSQLYYSVLAKTLSKKRNNKHKIFPIFWFKFMFDLLVIHRLFLGSSLKILRQRIKLIRGIVRMPEKNPISIKACRICGNKNLVQVLDLGEQYLTGVFPRDLKSTSQTKGPLQLVKCFDDGEAACGLVQLRHSYETAELFGDNYGYRSNLNSSMGAHLANKIHTVEGFVNLMPGDLVIDVGSNDGTTLAAYPAHLTRVGIDPLCKLYENYYPPGVIVIPSYFSAGLITKRFPNRKAKVITSFAMMYDLEDPCSFAIEIASLLDRNNGIWVFEQSYLPTMMERVSFDTVCHEHIEYYCLKQIEWLLENAGLRIISLEFNEVNGGSLSVVAAHTESKYPIAYGTVKEVLSNEKKFGLDELDIYATFRFDIAEACAAIKQFCLIAKLEKKRICALGASTKGNVLLQYCGLNSNDIEVIGEINPDKFGAYTPGSHIPIEEESRVLASRPDYLLILPWHFRKNFLSNPLYKGHKLVFPLPNLEIVSV